MSERIILNTCDCTGAGRKVCSIQNGTSFKISYHFTPQCYSPFSKVELRSFDLQASYWIKGVESEVINFTKTPTSCGNVIIDPISSQVKFIFQEYNLSNGKLQCKLQFKFADPSYPDGWRAEIWEGDTGIILI